MNPGAGCSEGAASMGSGRKGDEHGHGCNGRFHNHQGGHIAVGANLGGQIGGGQDEPVNDRPEDEEHGHAVDRIDEEGGNVGSPAGKGAGDGGH